MRFFFNLNLSTNHIRIDVLTFLINIIFVWRISKSLLLLLTFIFSLTESFKTSSWLLPFAEVIDVNGSIHSNRSSITFFTTFSGGSVSEDLICCMLILLSSFSTGSAWINVWLLPQLTYRTNANWTKWYGIYIYIFKYFVDV